MTLPTVCTIPLYPPGCGLTALVDPDDFEALAAFNWYAVRPRGRTVYVRRHLRETGGVVYMHRDVLRPSKEQYVDHINGDGLDNRRCNLRVATPAQNSSYRRKMAGTAGSRFKGVRRQVRGPSWRAELCNKHIGSFASEEEAARAYDVAAIEKFGAFASTNFHNGEGNGA